MELHGFHVPIRSQVLAMKPMPSLNEVFCMAAKDASHRGGSKLTHIEASTMYGAQNQKWNQAGTYT